MKINKLNFIAVIFLTISIIFIIIYPQSKLGIATLIIGDLLLLYSIIKEKLGKKK
jgi:hypothetical protein